MLSFEGHWAFWASEINFVMYGPYVRNQLSFLKKSPLTLVAIVIELDIGLRLFYSLCTHVDLDVIFVG